MRYLILTALLFSYQSAEARSLSQCSSSWRLGTRVVKVGDDVGRTLDSIDRASHRVQWLRGPSSKSWTLTTKGQNSKTIQIKLTDGRLTKICQY